MDSLVLERCSDVTLFGEDRHPDAQAPHVLLNQDVALDEHGTDLSSQLLRIMDLPDPPPRGKGPGVVTGDRLEDQRPAKGLRKLLCICDGRDPPLAWNRDAE